MFATMATLASEYALPLAIGAGTAVVGAVATRLWSSESADLEVDREVSGVGSQVLSRPLTPPHDMEDVRSGPTGVESRRTAEIAPEVILTAQDPQVTTVLEAEVDYLPEEEEVPENGALFVRVPQPDAEFDEEHIEKYLSASKAQMVFSTAAMQGQGFSRSVDLQKTVDKEEVPDDDRQHKVDVQFAKIKHIIGVGGRGEMPNKAISYSVTWHFVEVYNRPGEPPVKYDLTDKADIERLLEDQGINDVDDEMVDNVFTKLLSINREIKTLTEREVGKTKDCFLHDYAGNPNGLELYRPFSVQDDRVKRSSKHGKYGDTMAQFGFLKKRGGRLFGEYQVNQKGAEALNKIEQAAHFKRSILGGLSTKHTEKLAELQALQAQEETEEQIASIKRIEGEIKEITQVMQEVGSSHDTVMHFTLLELTRTHQFQERRWDGDSGTFVGGSFARSGEQLLAPLSGPEHLATLGPGAEHDVAAAKEVTDRRRLELSKTIARDYVDMVSRENVSLFRRKKYIPTKQDKQQAVEVGTLVHYLAAPNTPSDTHATRRLEVLEATQALNRSTFYRTDSKGRLERDSRGQLHHETVGREVFKDPKGERLILSAILRPPTGAPTDGDLAGYSGASDVVKDVLKEALAYHRAAVAGHQVKTYSAGSAYKAERVGAAAAA